MLSSRAAEYNFGVKLSRRGFQGHALGKLAVVEHDGNGRLVFDDRPFVLMVEGGYADLGRYP